ncbi:MAG TPA: hypothetical protein VJC04_01525 [Candidatus Paceibacterota bacterium]
MFDPIPGLAGEFRERMFYNASNRLDTLVEMRYQLRENARDGVVRADLTASRAERTVLDSTVQAFRNELLETSVAFVFLSWARETFSEPFARGIARTFSGREEVDSPVSPFSDREVRMTIDGDRFRRGLKVGARPFRQVSPTIAFATYGVPLGDDTELMAISLRLVPIRWNFNHLRTELLTRAPLGREGLALAAGIRYEIERRNRDDFSAVLGFQIPLGGVPIDVRLDTSGEILLSWRKGW